MAYDTALISIVPIKIPIIEGLATGWKCLIVDEACRDNIACTYGVERFYWRVSISRVSRDTPDRHGRFLYFRFLATYIYAARKGLTHSQTESSAPQTFWDAPGEYVEKSVLNLLAQNAGVKLRRSFNQHAFDGGASVQEQEEKKGLRPLSLATFLLRTTNVINVGRSTFPPWRAKRSSTATQTAKLRMMRTIEAAIMGMTEKVV